ncbi:MAG: MBL fold metallo-hydrolase [bacterium]
MEIIFLGTGTSMGVPVIGCECEVCRSNNPKNKRTRSSVFIRKNGLKFVIDTTQEFRLQLVREDIQELDFILYTHDHADHILGIDDLRPLSKKNSKTLPCYGSAETLEEIKKRFPYLFSEKNKDSWKPRLDLRPVEKKFTETGLKITPLPVEHGNDRVYGYRIGDFAYVSDLSELPDSTAQQMQDLEILVLGGLRFKPHYKHFHVDKAVETAQNLGAKQTYLTHLTHAIEHEQVDKELPDNINLAYDGLKLEIPEEE